MDPTERLYCLITLSNDANNLIKLLSDIEKAIQNGAILNKKYFSSVLYSKLEIPIIYAIQICAPIEIIKLLKKHWWRENNDFICNHHCNKCDNEWSITIKGNMTVYLNALCNYTSDNYIIEVCRLFNIGLLDNADLRHKLINEYKIE